MQTLLKLPKTAPTVFYQKEWMSLTDYYGYSGNKKHNQIIGRWDFIFTTDLLFKDIDKKGIERVIICTATRLQNCIRISDWRVVNYKQTDYLTPQGNILTHQGLDSILTKINVPLPSLGYYLGGIEDYKILTYRILKVVYKHNHNFITLKDYESKYN